MDPETIVRCYGCDRRVRSKATRREPTGLDGDLEIWCLECVKDVDDLATHLLAASNPDNAPPYLSLDEGEVQRFLNDEEG